LSDTADTLIGYGDDYCVGAVCHDTDLDVMFTITEVRFRFDMLWIKRADLDYCQYGIAERWERMPLDFLDNPPYLVYYHPYNIY